VQEEKRREKNSEKDERNDKKAFGTNKKVAHVHSKFNQACPITCTTNIFDDESCISV
jgi:hypothetical protein